MSLTSLIFHIKAKQSLLLLVFAIISCLLLTLYLIGFDIDSQILAFFGLASRLFLSARVKAAETFYYVFDVLFPMVHSLLASDDYFYLF